MNKFPKITVVIPCINAENTIQKTFDSLRVQNYGNLECIVIDGASTDSTLSIIEKNNDIIDILVSEKDNGASEAQNKGIKLATGDLIGYLHTDDYYEDNMLFEISNAYIKNKNSCDIFSYGLEIENLSDGKVIMSSFLKKNLELKLNNILFKHAMGHFYKKNIFLKYGYLKTYSNTGGDLYANDKEHLLRLCLFGVKNYVIEKVLYRMRAHSKSNTLSRRNILTIRYQHIEIADSFLPIYKDSLYKYNKLKDFKAHNLSLLFAYYVLTLSTKKLFDTFKIGYEFRGFFWFFDIFYCPAKEILYRASVKKWF
jgi:glycosyltransferase involved in cell wall biosynthesis